MNFQNLTTILLAGASIALGAFFGALRSKIFASKSRTSLHYAYYGFSILVFLIAIISAIVFWRNFFFPKNWFGISVLISGVLSSLALFFLTKKYLVIKDVYKTSELDPIVNNFTSSADKDEIKLFGGDLNFLGENPAQIDNHPQYTFLRSMAFRRVFILCETPRSATQRIRYGKILYELQGAELRFYNPESADLKVRGRIIQVHGVNKLLMYTKIKSGEYRALETDTANSNGALYNNIWDLVWDLATTPTREEIDSYINLFRVK